MGLSVRLLPLLFGLTSSNRALGPQPPSREVADADMADVSKKFTDLTGKLASLTRRSSKSADLTKGSRGGSPRLVIDGASPKPGQPQTRNGDSEESTAFKQSRRHTSATGRRVPIGLSLAPLLVGREEYMGVNTGKDEGSESTVTQNVYNVNLKDVQSAAAMSSEKEIKPDPSVIGGFVAPTSSPNLAANVSDTWAGRSSFLLPPLASAATILDDREYKLWRVDRQPRPCIGTTEKERTRMKRRDLPTNGFQERLSAILSDVAASGVLPNTQTFVWYNMENQRTQAFHMKLLMDPAVYKDVYVQHYKLLIPTRDYQSIIQQSIEAAQVHFDEDYYGHRLLQVYRANQAQQAVPAGRNDSRMLRASDDLVLETGPVLLFNTPKPLLLEELTDAVMESVEVAVLDAFKDHNAKPEPFWHSICLLPLPVDGTTMNLNHTRFLIGSKMDEAIFARALPTTLQGLFLAKNDYKDQVRQYRKDVLPKQTFSSNEYRPNDYRPNKYKPRQYTPKEYAPRGKF